jgi:hypothetical protein
MGLGQKKGSEIRGHGSKNPIGALSIKKIAAQRGNFYSTSSIQRAV